MPMLRMCRVGRLPAPVVAVLLTACGGEMDSTTGFLDHLYRSPLGEFAQISSYDTTGGNQDRLEIAAGDSAVLLDIEGPGVIQRIWITVSSSDLHYLRRIALRMYWDGETEPSVAVPLGDFFGNGFDKRHYLSLPMGVSSGGFYCYLPMPFRRRARVVVDNGTGRDVDAFYYNIGLVRADRVPRSLRTFHASWRRTARTADTLPHVVLEAEGQGMFVGLSLNAESYDDRLWFLEGDEVFVVDGDVRGQGTGTEDYFNAGWYFDQGTFAGAFHGLVLKDEERGRIAAYRWHLPDPVPFRTSMAVLLEHGHANTALADYATVAYWYQTEPHRRLPALPPANDRRVLSVKIPGTAVLRDAMGVAGADGGVRVTVDAPRPDRYEVVIYPIASPSPTTVRLLNGARQTIAASAEEPGSLLPPLTLGPITLEDRFEMYLSGPAVQAPAAVDLRPVSRWAREWNVVGPFPNPRRLGTEYSVAIDSAFGPEVDPSPDATYAGAAGQQVRWQRTVANEDGRVQLNPLFAPDDWVAAYARAYLYSPDDRTATLLLGTDDAHVLWVNGERLSERQGRHISRPDELEIPVQLRAGANQVLLKIADLDGGWAFLLRAADPDGDLVWSAEDRF